MAANRIAPKVARDGVARDQSTPFPPARDFEPLRPATAPSTLSAPAPQTIHDERRGLVNDTRGNLEDARSHHRIILERYVGLQATHPEHAMASEALHEATNRLIIAAQEFAVTCAMS